MATSLQPVLAPSTRRVPISGLPDALHKTEGAVKVVVDLALRYRGNARMTR